MSQSFLKLVSLVLFVTGDIKLLIILFINYKSHLLLANENSFFTGSSHEKTVQQTPQSLIKSQTDWAEIKCSHDIQGHDRILWYKHSHYRELTLMGYLVSDFESIEPKFQNKIIISGKANEYYSSLNLTDITPDSGGVYFCAAYHTAAQMLFPHY